MSLELYLTNKWIKKHQTSKREIANLIAIAARDIEQSQTPGLGAEWRFDIAYNAVVQTATAALAASGYTTERMNEHLRVLECLEFTLGWSEITWRSSTAVAAKGTPRCTSTWAESRTRKPTR